MELPDQMAAMAAHVDGYAAEMAEQRSKAAKEAPRFALDGDTVKVMAAASAALEAQRQSRLRRFHRQPMAFKNSPEGLAKEAWLERLGVVIRELDSFPRVAP